MTPRQRQRGAIFALTGPAYIWLAVTIFLPLAAMLYCSVLDISPLIPEPSHFTLRNYAAFFQKSFYLPLTWWSLLIGIWTTLFSFLVGYPAAYGLAKKIKGRWREALFLLIVLPFWSNALVRIFSWTMVLRQGGLIDMMVHAVFPEAPSMAILFTYPAVVVGLVHSYVPYMILTCYVSLQAIDDSLMEAARSLGANNWTVFRRVVFPLSLPGIISGAILIFVPVIGSFMEPRILGGAKGATLGMNIEEQFTVTANWPLGAALSFTLLAIVLIIFAVLYPILKRQGIWS
ncbi:MAG TPA: ABC transporter permease [Dongiaceae bacterium]|jgi:spermidine/putrescine transport system permease protein|nr:ABC transporter permease [Dongiaceae bacterium]